MKVKDLKRLIENIGDGEMEVVIASDLNDLVYEAIFTALVINDLQEPHNKNEKLVILKD